MSKVGDVASGAGMLALSALTAVAAASMRVGGNKKAAKEGWDGAKLGAEMGIDSIKRGLS